MSFSRGRMAKVPGAAWRGLRQVGPTSWSTRLEYATVLLLACVTEVAVRTVPLTRLAPLYGVTFGPPVIDFEGAAPFDELPAWAVHRIRAAALVMRRWPVQGECLRQSLVAGQRVRALHPELKLGVAKGEAGIVAHAWLVIGGRSLDPTSVGYDELPPPPT